MKYKNVSLISSASLDYTLPFITIEIIKLTCVVDWQLSVPLTLNFFLLYKKFPYDWCSKQYIKAFSNSNWSYAVIRNNLEIALMIFLMLHRCGAGR
jgi:hypothetical protein